ncbi:MAG: hypothetical protein H7Z40_23700 [Phycisphaerae bacterium]|nr:hypothetical protein [Gemmatimonadaceae bacterium]
MPTETASAIAKSPLARTACCALWLVLFCGARIEAQLATPPDSSARHSATTLTLGGMAFGVLTRAAPAYNGESLTELQLVQPVLAIGVARNSWSFVGMANAEGFTLKRGELNAGIYGEGYVDRRHPHTLVHEAMLTWMPRTPRDVTNGSSLAFSLSAGRGFVPFGSDDPMMRPLEKYPVNHHHAQILERMQAIAATRLTRGARSAAVEVAIFNGDEPAGPFHGPRWNRFGDSWAIRGTIQPGRQLELSVSEARVTSPELQQGGAFNHRQRHASIRFDRAPTRPGTRYLLAEWARTDERTNGLRAFRYHSALLEAGYGWRGATAAMRIEQTDRGEEGRLADPFRAAVGHVDFQILGVTQWSVATVALQTPSIARPFPVARIAGFVELSQARPRSLRLPSAFEPAAFYGADRIWSVSAGIRVHAGFMRHRMGRYGVMGAVDHTGTKHHGT